MDSYCADPSAATVTTLGEGNINDTYLVQTTRRAFVLQRINEQVFPDPQILIHNLQHLSTHLQRKAKSNRQRWEEVILVATRDGSLFAKDDSASLWRALSYIENSCTLAQVDTQYQAKQIGWALGHFHNRVADLDICEMKIPLPGFHHTSNYLEQYDQISSAAHKYSAASVFCQEMIENKRGNMLVLEDALNQGKIQQRIIHGDPKVGNILFDKSSNYAISLIDLDTIGPGILQHDIGDCLRSVCNASYTENGREHVGFNIDLCRSTLKGYFQETNTQLCTADRKLIYDGLTTITFELGLRFFTDFLLGGIYFKALTVEETLQKAVYQFSLLQSILMQEKAIRSLSMG